MGQFVHTSNLVNLNIFTTGNFTTALNASNGIALSDAGAGGTLRITAANIVVPGATNLNPITLTANGAAGAAFGNINLTLTGTQSVTLDSKAGAAKTSAPYELTVNGGAVPLTKASSISVSTKGNLTALVGGINLSGAGVTTSLSLASAKSLSVDDMVNSTFGYHTVSLSSGSTAPFLVDEGSTTANGTKGIVDAGVVSINAGGTITTNTPGSVVNAFQFSNPNGALTMTGVAGSITTLSTLNLQAATSITLGNAKTGAGSPLPDIGDNTKNNLSNLNIEADKGSFTAPLSTNAIGLIETSDGGNLTIIAANIVNSIAKSNAPITLSANGGAGFQAGVVQLSLAVPITLDKNSPASAKAPAPFIIQATGSSGSGEVYITSSAGTLTVNPGGVVVSKGISAVVFGGGKGLAVTDASLFSAASLVGTADLTSGAAKAFVIGAATVLAGGNGIVGGIAATNITVGAPSGITIANGASVFKLFPRYRI